MVTTELQRLLTVVVHIDKLYHDPTADATDYVVEVFSTIQRLLHVLWRVVKAFSPQTPDWLPIVANVQLVFKLLVTFTQLARESLGLAADKKQIARWARQALTRTVCNLCPAPTALPSA